MTTPILRFAIPYAVVATLITLFTFSNVGASFGGFVPYLIFWFGLPVWITFWILRLAIFLWNRRKRSITAIPHAFIKWSIEPTVSLLLLLLANSSILFLARFHASRPFLESAACRYLSLSPSDLSKEGDDYRIVPPDKSYPDASDYKIGFRHKIIGLFPVYSISIPANNCVRFITGFGDPDARGVAYYTGKGQPPNLWRGADYYTHISGPWWRWYTDY